MVLDRSQKKRVSEHIRQVVQPTGEWFVVTEFEKRLFLERVVLWALVEKEDKIDHVKAVGQDGLTMPRDEDEEVSFVMGSDMAPNGQSWADLYRQTKTEPKTLGGKEVSHLLHSEPGRGAV
jgi:hypothetical protein